MDLNSAIVFAQLVNAAYAVPPTNLTNRAGEIVNTGGDGGAAYEVVTTIYANDLATDMQPARSNNVVSIGLIFQAPATGDVVIALRGTEGVLEWIQDAKFLAVPCPFLPAAGNTLTVCGHSLGGALATLLALDLAANTAAPFNDPTVYTYASPRTGDATFVSTYNHVVPNTFRIANRLDLVPKLPLPPLYDHVLGLFELNPVKFGIPPKVLVKCDIPCEHFLSSYLFLLSQLAGGPVSPLDPPCVP